MRAQLVSSLIGAAVATILLPVATAEPRYFESTVLTDAADDYTASGALDIVALHVAEKYSIVDGVGRDTLQVRVELRNLDEFEAYAGQTKVEVTVGFKANGVDQAHSAVLSQFCRIPPPNQGAMCDPIVVEPPPHFATAAGGVTFVLDAAASGLRPGTVITDLFAATATLEQDQRVYHDVAPVDNMNQPHGVDLAPQERTGSYEVRGGFPFLVAGPTTSTERFIVPGGDASFTVRYTTHERHDGLDRVVFLYENPEGWTVEANLGSDFVVSQGGESVDVDFRVVAPPAAAVGDEAAIVVDAVQIQAGGHAKVPLHLVVSGPRVPMPEYAFELVGPATLATGGTPAIKVKVLHEGEPLLRYRVAADFRQGDEVEATVAAVEEGDGVYAVPFAFPRGGTWTMDVYVSELRPSPVQSFQIEVDPPRDAPAPGWAFALVVLGLAWAVRRRAG